MADPQTPPGPMPESRAVPKKQTRLSLVWTIPIIAALVGVWVAVTRIRSEGPKITIVFQSAEGLEAGKTKINYAASTSAPSATIRLTEDHQRVVATAQMAPRTEDFLVEDTRMWVVRPRISGANVTGLGTLISGAYIGVEIGNSKEPRARLRGARYTADHHRQCARPFLRAENPRPGFAGHRHADVFPPPAGRPGRVVRTRQRRPILHPQRFRESALRSVRHPKYTLLAGERGRSCSFRPMASACRPNRCCRS